MTDNCWVVFERDGRGDSIIAVCTEKREADAIKRQNEQDRYIVGANLISSRDKRLNDGFKNWIRECSVLAYMNDEDMASFKELLAELSNTQTEPEESKA